MSSFFCFRSGLGLAACLMALFLLACERESGSTQPASQAAQELTASEMNASISEALQDKDPVLRMKLLSTALVGLDAENVEGAAEAFKTRRSTVSEFDIHPFMSQWATFDPKAALEFATVSLREGLWRRRGYESIIDAWVASGGGEEAFAFSEALKEEESPISTAIRSNLAGALILNGDFEIGMPILEEMPEGSGRNSFLLGLIFDLARERDLDDIVEFANSIPEDAPNNLKGAVFSQVLGVLTKTRPEQAAALYDGVRYEDFVRGDALAVIASEWIHKDPFATMEWVLSQPPSDARDAAVRGAVYRWQMEDSERSEPWLREHLSEPSMAVALYPFAQWLVYRNPVESLAWGMRVPDKRERFYVMQQSFVRWRREDPVSAMEWFEVADLPELLREDLGALIKMESLDSMRVPTAEVVEEADSSAEP
jgi:hypothetical protein